MKSRIEIECVCEICGLLFTLHNVLERITEVGSGYHIGGMRCLNCGQMGIDFDLKMVAVPYPSEVVVEHRRKMRGSGKKRK